MIQFTHEKTLNLICFYQRVLFLCNSSISVTCSLFFLILMLRKQLHYILTFNSPILFQRTYKRWCFLLHKTLKRFQLLFFYNPDSLSAHFIGSFFVVFCSLNQQQWFHIHDSTLVRFTSIYSYKSLSFYFHYTRHLHISLRRPRFYIYSSPKW